MNRLKQNKILIVLFAIFLLVSLASCKKTPTLEFSKSEWNVVEGDEFTLTPTITNLKGDDLVIYTFSAEGVVSNVGNTFKALKKGNVTITASLKGYSDVTKTITVVVTEKPVDVVKVTSILLSGLTQMEEGESQTLSASISPQNASNKTLTWTSSDNKVISVENGVVTAIAKGSATITAKASDGSNVTGTITINVIAEDVPITGSITLTLAANEGFVGDELIVSAVIETNASDEALLWEVVGDAATVSDGVLTLVKAGSVTVKAYLVANQTIFDSLTLTVYNKITDISLSLTKDSYFVGDSENVALTISPSGTKGEVSWASSDESVVSVSNGKIVALKVGTATITATAKDGSNVSKSIVVTVNPKADTSVTLANGALGELSVGDKVDFNGMEFLYGVTAFKTLAEALAVAEKTTYVAPGTYSETVTLSKSNFELLGPNTDINPMTGSRLDEAIITGTINLAKSIKNVKVKGLAFTGKGMINSAGLVQDIEVSYNNVYDTNTDVAAWVEARNESEAVFDFWVVAGEESKNIVIKYNKFSNVLETNIMVARSYNVNVSYNGFYNFGQDAIRVDGGYNFGSWVFEHNEFINDKQSGNNGIYLQSVSGTTDAIIQSILISHSVFKNIGLVGGTSSYNGAISIRTYQEQGLTLDILYNVFETCENYLNLRNNGATAATFVSSVNYNKFVGVPSGVYHRNIRPDSSDTASSNPFLTNMDYNYFEDKDGNPIADLSAHAAKFLDLKSYANNYATKEEYEEVLKSLIGFDYTMVVNGEWASLENGAEVEYGNYDWVIGTNAFSSISSALTKAVDGEVIKVVAGNYSEELVININNITILGANNGVNPVTENRNAESVINKKITVETGINGFTLDGFELQMAGQIVLKNNTANTTFKNNVLTGTSADGIVHGPELASEITTNVVMSNNYSVLFSNYRFAWFQNVDGFEAVGNSLKGGTTYDFVNVGGYMEGEVNIIDNYYTNSLQSFLYVKGVKAINAVIEGNYLVDLANTIIDFRNMVGSGAASFEIVSNTFISSGCGWAPIRIRTAGYKAGDSIYVNVENNKFIDSHYLSGTLYQFIENPSYDSAAEGFKKIYTIGANYYEVNKVAFTELTDDNFSDAAISFAAAYAKEDDVPTYEKEDEVKPKAIQITNKIDKLDAFENHQIFFKITPSDVTNKKVAFSSSDTSVATVSSAGLVSAKSQGTVTITIYSIVDNSILDSFTFEVIPVERIEIRYDGNAVLEKDKDFEFDLTYIGDEVNFEPTYESSNTSIATVDSNGKVSALAKGNVIITVKFKDLEAKVGFTILDPASPLSEILQIFADANNGIVKSDSILYIGSDDGTADFPHDIYNAASDYWAGTLPTITKNMLSTTAENYDGRDMQSLEFIVVHDTGATPSTSTAKANSGWCTNSSNTGSSWHYTIGNDGLYQQVDDTKVAWHAGDGANWADSTTLYDTGVAYEGERPTVTVGGDGYFYVNGKKSLVLAPAGSTTIATLGLVIFKGENGNYFIPTTHITASGAIAARGGNLNGIGIEMAINLGSDVYLTWQMNAKFIATLLVKHNLTPDRVWFHNSFSNKRCPQTMMHADKVGDFLEMVYTEYNILKNFSDYTITFTSSNPDIIDNTGRVKNAPKYTTNVPYTVTVSKGGVSESITLNALVVGLLN